MAIPRTRSSLSRRSPLAWHDTRQRICQIDLTRKLSSALRGYNGYRSTRRKWSNKISSLALGGMAWVIPYVHECNSMQVRGVERVEERALKIAQ